MLSDRLHSGLLQQTACAGPLSAAILLGFLSMAHVALGASWHVEKDGSGEFTIIQDAVNAAAPGDTILIGPGRFEERPYYEEPDYIGRITALIDKSGLTMIGTGSGADGTVIGSTLPDYIQNDRQSIGLFMVEGVSDLSVLNLRIENVNLGFVVMGDRAGVWDCVFSEFGDGGLALISDVSGLTVERSTFELGREDSVNALGARVGATCDDMVVRGCSFAGTAGSGIVTWEGSRVLIQDCTFQGYHAALGLRRLSDSVVERCTITVASGHVGIDVREVPDLKVEDCVIDSSSGDLAVRVSGSVVEFDSCLIRGGQVAAVWPAAGGDYLFRNCRIERQPGTWFVESYLREDITDRIDMRYNWWGETDSTTIANGILDARTADPQECIDNPTLYYCPRDTVQFWPVLDEPPFVTTEPKSVGGMKGRFRVNR